LCHNSAAIGMKLIFQSKVSLFWRKKKLPRKGRKLGDPWEKKNILLYAEVLLSGVVRKLTGIEEPRLTRLIWGGGKGLWGGKKIPKVYPLNCKE